MAQNIESLEILSKHIEKVKRQHLEEIEAMRTHQMAMETENYELRQRLQTCLDELDFKNGQVDQLKMENTKKWRVDERSDWKALVDSVQQDREELIEKNEILNRRISELTSELATKEPQSPKHSIKLSTENSSPNSLSSTISPTSFTTNLKKELEVTIERLENERHILALERREAQRLREELNGRRDREKWQAGQGLLVQLAKFSRMWQRSPMVPRHLPVNV